MQESGDSTFVKLELLSDVGDAKLTFLWQAEVGDDVWGDDPTVHRLQELAAAVVGKEAAIFVPSGTMGNLSAVLAHCHERRQRGKWPRLAYKRNASTHSLQVQQARAAWTHAESVCHSEGHAHSSDHCRI